MEKFGLNTNNRDETSVILKEKTKPLIPRDLTSRTWRTALSSRNAYFT